MQRFYGSGDVRVCKKVMETLKVTIPHMQSAHCQMTVTNTVESLGAIIKSIAPTRAEIELRNGLTKDAVITAIERSGYKVANA